MATGALRERARVFKAEDAFQWAFWLGFVMIPAVKLLAQEEPIIGGCVASALGIAIMWLYKSDQGQVRPKDEQPRLGDEVYYLGLLYTLTSLCAALVTLFLLDRGEQTLVRRTDEMIGSFGIALLTTMAGIVMRMTLQRHGPESQETIIRIPVEIEGVSVDLERYAHELRRQLQNSTNAFEAHANKAILQAKTTHAHMDQMVQAFHDGLEVKSKAGLQRLETIYKSLAQRAEETSQRTEEQREGIQGALRNLETLVRSMEQSIERIQVGSSETAENLETIGAQAKASALEVAQSSKTAAEGLNALAEATAGKQLEEALEPIVRQIRHLAEITSSEFEGRRQLREAVEEIAQAATTAGRYTQNLKDTEAEIQRINTGLKSVQSALQHEGFRLAEVLKQAILALEQAEQTDNTARGILQGWWRR